MYTYIDLLYRRIKRLGTSLHDLFERFNLIRRDLHCRHGLLTVP